MTETSTSQVYLVTGGTGFLGRHLTRLLLKNKQKVRILSRKGDKSLEALGVEMIEGSLQDLDVLHKAAQGTAGIFHLAGYVAHSRLPIQEVKLYETNVLGTLNIINTAAQTGSKVVYASSSGTVGCSREADQLATEESDFCFEEVAGWPYYRTKIEAERQARELALTKGVKLTLLRPSMMLGPGDTEFRSTRLIRRFLEGKIPVIPPGGISFVDVRDVAIAFWSAMQHSSPNSLSSSPLPLPFPKETRENKWKKSKLEGHGSSEERLVEVYLLTAANWTLGEFFQALEKTSGVRGPMIPIPSAVLITLAKLLDSPLLRDSRGSDSESGVMESVSFEMSTRFWGVDNSRAKHVLSFSPRDPIRTIADTVRWIADTKVREPFRAKL